MDPEAWAIRETHTKTLALVAETDLEDFVKSEGYVQVSSALTASVDFCRISKTQFVLYSYLPPCQFQ